MGVDELKAALTELKRRGESVYGFTLSPDAFTVFRDSVRQWFISRDTDPRGVAIADEIWIEGVKIACSRSQSSAVVRWDSGDAMARYLVESHLEKCWEK